MYTVAQTKASEQIKNVCLANTARAARNVLGYKNEEVSSNEHCKQFLKDNFSLILSCALISKKDKIKILLDLYLPFIMVAVRKIKHSGGY